MDFFSYLQFVCICDLPLFSLNLSELWGICVHLQCLCLCPFLCSPKPAGGGHNFSVSSVKYLLPRSLFGHLSDFPMMAKLSTYTVYYTTNILSLTYILTPFFWSLKNWAEQNIRNSAKLKFRAMPLRELPFSTGCGFFFTKLRGRERQTNIRQCSFHEWVTRSRKLVHCNWCNTSILPCHMVIPVHGE